MVGSLWAFPKREVPSAPRGGVHPITQPDARKALRRQPNLPGRRRPASLLAVKMQTRALLTFLLTFLLITCGASSSLAREARVLFVGNSLMYVGNTPAIYSAIAAANGIEIKSDMIVQGGATLAERDADGSVANALASRKYTAVVLQERGGDLICAFGPESCEQSRKAISGLVELARDHGAKVVLLGTYQANPSVSKVLVQKESLAASEAGIPYIEVSERLRALNSSFPELNWFAEDGLHPGAALALLNATLIYKTLHGSTPRNAPIAVRAPIYRIKSGLTAILRQSNDPPPLPNTPSKLKYRRSTVQVILQAMNSYDGS